MKEPMMWVMWYLMLSSVPLMAAAVIVKQLIIGYGEPVQVGTVRRGHMIRTITRKEG